MQFVIKSWDNIRNRKSSPTYPVSETKPHSFHWFSPTYHRCRATPYAVYLVAHPEKNTRVKLFSAASDSSVHKEDKNIKLYCLLHADTSDNQRFLHSTHPTLVRFDTNSPTALFWIHLTLHILQKRKLTISSNHLRTGLRKPGVS